MNQQYTATGSALNPLGLPLGAMAYKTTTKAYWANQFYGEYLWHRVRLDAEYRRYFNVIPCLPGSDLSTDARSWYVSGSYRAGKHFSVGSYYSHYTVTQAASGIVALVVPAQSPPTLT
jgi:hypothetical protein